MERSLAEIIARFVPRRVAGHPLLDAPLDQPYAEPAECAVLFADISGFTALSDDLARRGAQASEQLTAILNDYFGRLTSIIDSHGGDVVKFAGDALVALWTAPDPAGHLEACWRAAHCAREIQLRLRGYRIEGSAPLGLRVSIGVGPVLASFVGGVYGRWEFVLAGAPLRQVGNAVAHAEPGSVVLSPEAGRLLAPRASGRPLADDHLQLRELEPLEPTPLEPLSVDSRRAEHLKAFVPRAIVQRIVEGHTQWLGELRRLTVVFVNLPDMSEEIGLARAQEIMCALQAALYRYEGSVNKLSVDDKGVTLVAAFGLPPLFHEDDPVRAVKSALEIEGVLAQMGVRCSIGVTTGRVYCGAVGGDARREYTVIGRPVNVAARLMMAAGPAILIDAATYSATHRSIDCEERGRVELKGLAALEVWQPRRATAEGSGGAEQSRLVGRAAERARLRASLTELALSGRSSVILVEGEAGIGKSCLIGDLLGAARDLDVALFVGCADAIDKSTAYHVWRGIASEVLDCAANASAEERGAQVMRSLGHDPELGELLPLLNGILPLDLLETKRSAQMSAETRAQNLRDLLLRLIQRAAKGRPIVVVIDDLHWMDSASWGITLQLAREVAPLLLVLATRPMDSPPAELASLIDRAERIQLEALSQRDTLQLVATRLGVDALPPEVAQLIAERAEGHPLFSEEIGYALRDSGRIEIENGRCRLRGDLSGVDLPSTVEGVITTRIDRLAPHEQLTLKVASVIGRVFRARELWSIHPMSREWDSILGDLRTLDAADLTPLEEPDPQLSYVFKHVITRDVAYSLMLFAQRQELHRAAAEWYEREHGDDLAMYYPLLAHHWAGAGVDSKTVDYLERAAARALHSYANHEVVRFLREAIERSGAESNVDAQRRTQWESMLGEAKRGLGSYPEAGRHMERALAQIGFPIPSSAPRLLLGILVEGAHQLWQRLRAPGAPEPERAERLMQAAHLSERIFMIYFFAAQNLKMMYSGLAAVNLAQRTGRPSVVLARGYCTLQVMMASLGLHGQARYFAARAQRTAAEVDHVSSTMWVLLARSVTLSGLGRWSEAEPPLDEAAELAERLGDGRSWCEITASKGTTTGARGAYLESIGIYEAVLKNAERRGDFQSQGWGVLGQARGYAALRRLDRLDETLARASELMRIAGPDIDLLTQYDHRALRALRELWCRRDGAARAELVSMRDALRTQRAPNQWMLIHPFGVFAEASAELWARHPERSDDRALARAAVRRLRGFARIFTCAGPRASWLEGRLAQIAGRPAQALESWRAGLAASRALQMAFDEWLCCTALAAASQSAVPDRAALAQRAGELARQIGFD